MIAQPRGQVVICSKSRWAPAIRREHALAQLASAGGHRVVFVEAPQDVRVAAQNLRRWLGGFAGRRDPAPTMDDLAVLRRSTLVPPHRSRIAYVVDAALLRRVLRHVVAGEQATVVATTPWQWRAVAAVDGVRRVFDCADDWSEVLSSRSAWLRMLYERISAEADAVVVSNPSLAPLFPHARVAVVPNGTSTVMLDTPITCRPATRTMAYAGTLSERFDAPLVAEVMSMLPDWRLEIYGECRYAQSGGRPGGELQALLDATGGRVVLRGVVGRAELRERLDAASILVLPHRPIGANTGDSMKLYDYAARGRPIVSTRWSPLLAASQAPGVHLAETPGEWVTAVATAMEESADAARNRRSWAQENSWPRRWSRWSEAVFGA